MGRACVSSSGGRIVQMSWAARWRAMVLDDLTMVEAIGDRVHVAFPEGLEVTAEGLARLAARSLRVQSPCRVLLAEARFRSRTSVEITSYR